jgi:hypothetical protein
LNINLSSTITSIGNWTADSTNYVNLSVNSQQVINWSNITGMPTGCPAGSYLTNLTGTNVTCISAMRTIGENVTGNYNFQGVGNVTVSGFINLTTSTVGCLWLPGGGKFCGNATCTTLYSPNGLTIMEACN